MSQSPESSDSGSRIKIALLSVLIVLCLGFLIWRFWPATVTPEVPPKDAVDVARDQITAALNQAGGEYATVSPERLPDNASIVIAGWVESQAELDELNKRVKALSLTVPIKLEVTLRPKRR